MTTAQVVETSVTVDSNSPIQDYVHPDDQTHPTFSNRFIKQNNLFTQPSRFFIHFLAVTARLRRENA